MKLYDRDYTKLSEEEYGELLRCREQEAITSYMLSEMLNIPRYSKAVRHHTMLFPNNYLDAEELKEEERLNWELEQFKLLLNSDNVTERKILNHIREKRSYFIVGALLWEYLDFGHHEAYLFPEFQLGNSFQADYLLVGKNSGGWNFAFVELEAPIGSITLKDGELGGSFRKGVKQIYDWDRWLEAYYPSLPQTFNKSKIAGKALPEEFLALDKTRINYVVIAGRRADFNENTYRIRRRHQRDWQFLLHYDNLIEAAKSVIGETTY